MSTSFETVSATRPDEHLPADVLARLRQLLFHELRTEVSGAAVGHFEVAWEIAEDGVAWSQETVEDIEDALARMDEGGTACASNAQRRFLSSDWWPILEPVSAPPVKDAGTRCARRRS